MRLAVLFLALALATPAAAQSRIDAIAAEFTKTKSQTKSKHGVVTQKYREMVSVPWQAHDVRDYAGHYVSLGDPLVLDVHVNSNGLVSAHGSDEQTFEIRDARIKGAVLTGTKVYRDGRTEFFEAGFLKRSDRDFPGERFSVLLGVGVLVAAPAQAGITGTLHVFLRRF